MSESNSNGPGTGRRACERLILVVVCLTCLAPFAGKAFHVDDPLFVWSGQWIQQRPFDFYGASVNWLGKPDRLFEVNHNPPGFAYYLALWAAWFGWSESALHWAVFALAVAAALGTYALALQLGSRPLEAALIFVLSPVFLVSATTVMCDLMMVCFWVWAVALWMRGLDRRAPRYLIAAVACVCVAVLSKYFAISLLPLLLVRTLFQVRASRWWAALLLVPAALLVVYEGATRALYGRGLIAQAVAAAGAESLARGSTVWSHGLTALSFIGGCVVALICFAPMLWKRRTLVGGVVLAALCASALVVAGTVGNHSFRTAGGAQWGRAIQVGLFACAGFSLLVLAAADLRRRRDSNALLLACWVFGTFVFLVFLSQFVAARIVLTLAPAAAILIGRRLEGRSECERRWTIPRVVALGLAACVALAVTWADWALANSVRKTADEIAERWADSSGEIWFQGHWGFQYYMQQRGARPIAFRQSPIRPGDHVVIPMNNTNTRGFAPRFIDSAVTLEERPSPWLATMNQKFHAGFYSEVWGPAPYLFGRVPPELYRVYRIKSASN